MGSMVDEDYFLLLDDSLSPAQLYEKTKIKIYGQGKKWKVVKSYSEFTNTLQYCAKLPKLISFDHDLCQMHNSKRYLFETTGFFVDNKAMEELHYGTMGERSGYHCAKWLVEFCLSCNYDLPDCMVHYDGNVGSQNILYALDQFEILKIEAEHSIINHDRQLGPQELGLSNFMF